MQPTLIVFLLLFLGSVNAIEQYLLSMAAQNMLPGAATNLIRPPPFPPREEIMEIEIEVPGMSPKPPMYPPVPPPMYQPVPAPQMPMSNAPSGLTLLDLSIPSSSFGGPPRLPSRDFQPQMNAIGTPLLEPPMPPLNIAMPPNIIPNDSVFPNIPGLKTLLSQLPTLNINQILSPPSNALPLADPTIGVNSRATGTKSDLLNSPQSVPASVPAGNSVAPNFLMALGAIEALDVIM